MSGSKMFPGLCLSCMNASGCTFPREPGRPIWQCEEFIGFEPHLERNSCEGGFPTRTGLIREEKDGEGWIGLCTNCENRKTCKFPKPDSGVWHCDEYQ